MGIFDFLKKLGKEKEIEEVVVEKISFSEIGGWVEKKVGENEIKEKEILSEIEGKINDFVEELREKIVVLEGFDVDAKKEKDKIKNIVIDSRAKYIEAVEDLIEKLNDLNEEKLEKFVEKVNKIFFDFNKSSFKNYERATILIGKEMASIKECRKIFSKYLLKTFEDNKQVVDSFKNFLKIKEKLNAIDLIDKTLNGISENKSSLKKKIIEKEEESKILKQNLEKIKTSSSYLENLEKQKKIESLREESRKNILELKQIIDFKALASFFHIFEDSMKIVKEHRENFQMSFEKDNGEAIIGLVEEAKLSNDEIVEKIKKISLGLEEIKKNEGELKKDETQAMNFMIKDVGLEIDSLKIEKVKEEKREDRFKENKEELMILLREELWVDGVVVTG